MAKVGPYVELHARSAFSFLRGASLPEEYAAACSANQQHAMALLDLDGVYGSPRFHMAAQKTGVVAHIGAEVSCTDGGRYPLLARNRKGYQNLCRLISLTKLRVPKHPETTGLLFKFDGTIQSGLGDPRQAQLGLRMSF